MSDALTLMSKGRELRKILDEAYDVIFEIRQAETTIQDERDYFSDLSKALAQVCIKVDEMFIMSSERP